MAPTLFDRRIARRACGAQRSMRVDVVAGSSAAPRIVGRSYYWTTLSGKTEVHHPNAYGWRTLYHASTLRVEVGEQWLLDQRAAHGHVSGYTGIPIIIRQRGERVFAIGLDRWTK